MVEMSWSTSEHDEDDSDWPWQNWTVHLTMVINDHVWGHGPIWTRYHRPFR